MFHFNVLVVSLKRKDCNTQSPSPAERLPSLGRSSRALQREADGCPSFLENRGRRERSFFIEKVHSARRFSPQGHRVRAPCPNKRRKDCVCHRVSNNEDADPHTILNALLVLAFMIERKLYSYQNARFKQISQ